MHHLPHLQVRVTVIAVILHQTLNTESERAEKRFTTEILTKAIIIIKTIAKEIDQVNTLKKELRKQVYWMIEMLLRNMISMKINFTGETVRRLTGINLVVVERRII